MREAAVRLGVGLLTAGVLALGVSTTSWTAGGPDAHAYVTQAELLLRGALKTPVPIASEAPWPDAIATFVPAGYRRVPGQAAVTPMTGPGLPLLMAGAWLVAGYPALFLIVPLTGGLLVWATWGIGRRIASGAIALGAAWLVATSPTFLMIFRAQMSDVPAAAFWALATLGLLDRGWRRALLAGSAAGMAILIRPNLVPLAAAFAAWLLWHRRDEPWRVRLQALFAFSAPVVLACLAIAAINAALFGSPLESGYGTLGPLFSFEHLSINAAKYGRWFVETQTPVAVLGAIAVMVPWRRLWPSPIARDAAPLLAMIVAIVWVEYCAYLTFDAWWFLRFLLPSWPAIAIGTAVVIVRALERLPAGRLAAGAIVIVIGLAGVRTALAREVFPDNEGERRYATIAELVARATPPDAAIVTGELHAGPLRFYTGRVTVRFDVLDPAWLDRAVAWLQQQGRPVYLLIEDWEMPAFEQRFAAGNTLGKLTLAPVLAYRAYHVPGTVYLFDPLSPDGPTLEPPPIRHPRPRAAPPAPRAVMTGRPR